MKNELRVWLSHDVDWLEKNFLQVIYYTINEKRFYHIASALKPNNSYWNFDAYQEVETKYGAKSTFFILNESIKPKIWNLKSIKSGYGRYSINDKRLKIKLQELIKYGWEVGMHGSYNSYIDFDLLKVEKNKLENIIGKKVVGIRQHHLNNKNVLTWNYHKKLGFKYDSSWGKKNMVGYHEGYTYPFSPFKDSFTVFPVILMDTFLIYLTKNLEKGKKIISKIIDESIDKNALLTVIWHQRSYNKLEFPLLFHWYNFLLSEIKNKNGKFVLPENLVI